ncbi:MAG: hypothetical protein JXA30_16850 [Deltaproteobacteria bacterium]|nr:hypothetical protein [Deltaproteobacteria bacterium]
MVEELLFRSDNAFLCLLLNRRTKSIRVIDFRSGALPAKRLFIQSVAQREGVKKAIILVEKDEVSSWTRVGFVREGTIPGFYKRSDGHLVGCVIGDKMASVEASDESQKIAEKTINAAKKATKDNASKVGGIKIKEISEKAAAVARDALWARGSALAGFDPFGRDAKRLYIEVIPKRGKSNLLSAEYQECFGHSLIEILRPPKSSTDVQLVIEGLAYLSEELKRRNIVSAFNFSPFDDIGLATAFIATGFRKTGLLAQGVLVGKKHTDAVLWTRKLADPAGGDEPHSEIENDDEIEEDNDEGEEEEEDE